MKCARCGHDSKLNERPGRVCPGCKREFAFEPRSGDPLPDMAWKSAIEWVSSNGTVRFTAAHLHHAIARRIKPKKGGGFGLMFIGFAVAMVGASAQIGELAVVGSLLIIVGIVVLTYRSTAAPFLTLEASRFTSLFERWCEVHGKPKGLIEPRTTRRALSDAMRRELESYSFDRAVICDQSETVDVLLGNDFHFENNCAVLTAGGYPEHAAPMIKTMLLQNPRLEVFVLHDATVEGCVLAHMLRNDPKWFGGRSVKVYDVALRPAQADKQKALRWRVSLPVVEHPALTSEESRWLAKWQMRLTAFSPEQTIKRLFRAMQHMPEQAAGDSGSSSDGSSSSDTVILWSTDAHASDGGGDSFG